MLEVIKMNKKHPFEAFRIPEDGIVDLVELSSWVGNNEINMSSIKPGHYIIKDMLDNTLEIKGSSKLVADLLNTKGEFFQTNSNTRKFGVIGMVCTGLLVNEVKTSKHKKEVKELKETSLKHTNYEYTKD